MSTMLRKLSKDFRILPLMILSCSIGACELLSPDEAIHDLEPMSAGLIPSETWVPDALFSFQDLNRDTTAYIVYSLVDGAEPEITVAFDSSHHILAISSQTSDGTNHIFRYESGLLEYSSHQNQALETLRLAAYANAKPFAAATGLETWETIAVTDLSVDQAWVKRVLATAEKLQKTVTQDVEIGRLVAEQGSLHAIVGKGAKHHYLCNIRAGDELQMELESENEDVFFSVSTDKATKMDYRKWDYRALASGDVLITVFAPGAPSEKMYKLTWMAKRNTQSPSFAAMLAAIPEGLSEP